MKDIKGQKNLGIEGLRAIAILSVLCFHISLSLQHFGVTPGSTIHEIFSFGKFGVHLFFCISGFVIAFSLKRHSNALSFLKARVIRLWPSLVIFHLCLYFLWTLQIGPPIFQALNFFDFLLSILLVDPKFVSTLTGLDFQWTTGVLWSLTIELVFYLLSALSVYVLKIKNYIGVWLLIGISITIHLFVKIFPLSSEITKIENYVWANCVLYLPWFVLGSTLHDIMNAPTDRLRARFFLVLSLLFLFAGNLASPDFSGKYILGAVLIPLLIVFITWRAAAGSNPKRVLNWRILQSLGRVSYEYYLIHEILIIAGFDAFGIYFDSQAVPIAFLIFLAVTYSFVIYILSKILNLVSHRITNSRVS